MIESRLWPGVSAGQGPRRFLFLFSDTGGGHRASAQAVREGLVQLYGSSALVELVDIFVELHRWPFHRLPDWYPAFVGLNGVPWGMGFHFSNRVALVKTMSRLFWPYTRRAVCRILREHPADVIVSFHPVPNYSVLMALQCLGWHIPVAIVIVDLVTAHAAYFAPGAEAYLVPTPAAEVRALRCGIPSDRVRVVGMPTRRAFVRAMSLSQEEARTRLQLPRNRPVVLITGGGEGMGPLKRVVEAVARRRPRAHIVVVAGHNRALREALSRSDLPVAVHVTGFVSNMEIWMRAADILVTKAGPNTLAEAFVIGLPLVLYSALPGQEEGNVSHVVENGAGIWAPSPQLAADAVVRLLTNSGERVEMSERSRALAYPSASEHIAQHLWRLSGKVGWGLSPAAGRNPSPQQEISASI